MYIRQVTVRPALGKGAEVRSFLLDRVKSNPQNLTGGLSEVVFGDVPTFVLSSSFDNMEALQKERDAAHDNPAVMEGRAQMDGMSRAPVEVSLNEILVRGDASSQGRFISRIKFYPALGKPGEMRPLLEEHAKALQAAGRTSSACSIQMFQPSGPIYTIRDTFETLAEYAPGIQDAILQRHTLMAPDIESVFELPEGNPHHGEMTLDQFFHMRPIPGYARYRTPIQGLYLCGAGSHPGGGVTGLPGSNAAREILKDWS